MRITLMKYKLFGDVRNYSDKNEIFGDARNYSDKNKIFGDVRNYSDNKKKIVLVMFESQK